MALRTRRTLVAVVLFSLFCAEIATARLQRDFSGDAMQQHSSRMMNSPIQRIPPVLGLSLWPFTPYLPAPSSTIVNVQVNLPALEEPSARPRTPSPAARPKFWTNRCGVFVEVELSP